MTLAQAQSPNNPNADRVKVLFQNAYGAYKQHAWGHDDLRPVSGSYNDGRNGWGATIIDSMSTMHVMGLDDLFNEAVSFVGTIDFSKSHVSETVNVFESSTRYLGGLLSAYELTQQKHPILLQKARELGDKLAFAWQGNNNIPFSDLDFTTNTTIIKLSNIEQATGMVLEFNRLSSFTGNDTYRLLADKSLSHIATLGPPLPGLPGQCIDPSTGSLCSGYITFGGGSSGYFYSLLRRAMLPGADPLYADTWMTSVNSAISILIRTSTVADNKYIADYDDNKRIRTISSHQKCFAGGDWIVGGKLFNNVTMEDFGLQMTDACLNTYYSTATGLGPDSFAFLSSNDSYTGGTPATADQMQFYSEHGFYITNGTYILRPEVLQSNLYAWRTTGDAKYLDAAEKILEAITKLTQQSRGVPGLADVMVPNVGYVDDTPSFFFSAVLKYLYLTFDNPNNFNLDNYIISSEGHLFARENK